MRYSCDFCGFVSDDIGKVRVCEAQDTKARFSKRQEVYFVCPVLGEPLEIRGKIEEVVYAHRTHAISYRIKVGNNPRLKHQNCIYGGVKDIHVLRSA